MPRQARLDSPGALHHIMVRGIDRTAIFKDDQDRARFLERLGENITDGRCSIYAWVLMNNHVHLLFKSGKRGISAAMRKLLTWYAQYFNRRHGRTGHLFQNRYKIREECSKAGVKEAELMKGSRRRKVSLTRAAIALRCKEEVGCSGAEIASHLGVNTTSINRAVEKAERTLE